MNRMKVFLGDMHKPKDLQDVDVTRRNKLTFSLRSQIDALERTEREEYKFNTLKPLEDFVQPDSPTQSRSTGYEPGHVRSLLRLDSFGPASSMRAQQERAIGRVPHAHNMDRFMVTEPHNALLGGGAASPGNNSRISTASSYNSYEFAPVRYKGDRGPRTTLAKKTLRYTANHQISAADLKSQWGVESPGGSGERVDMHAMHGMFHSSSSAIPRATSRPASPKEAAVAAGDKLMVNFHSTFDNPTTAALIAQQEARRRPTKLLSRGDSGSVTRPGVSTADRLTLDPLLKRTLWYKTHAQNEADRREAIKAAHREARQQAAQRALAAEEQRAVRDFERHLVLAKIQV